jgi:nitrous oxidase accessory protein NosD
MNQRTITAIFILAATILFAGRPASAQVLVVGTKGTGCSTPTFSKIQDAIDVASAGARIRVCAGTYAEQLTVTKSLTIHGDNGALVQPINMTANVSTLPEATAAVIYVSNAADVNIENLIIDGSKNGIAECSPFLVGVLYQNSSGALDHNAIRRMELPLDLNGCQSGDGVDVISTGTPTTVTVSNNSIHGYQKNGVTANEAGTTVVVRNNTVSGVGLTDGAAQNGIQIAFGAAGQVIANNVSNNQWEPCTSPATCSTAATGILVLESNNVVVEQNTLNSNQLSVYVQANNANVQQNLVLNTPILDSISLIGNNNTASQNKVVHSGQADVVVNGNNNQVVDNEIVDAPVGIWKVTGSTGTVIADNRFFATFVEVQDPAANRTLHVQPRQ